MDKVIITGAAGFIGSHVIERFVEEYGDKFFIAVDKLTYAADMNHLSAIVDKPNFQFIHADITDLPMMLEITSGASVIINLAAESHVDNSFQNSLPFTHTNTIGTHVLLECCLQNSVEHFIHVSTDEVYGENNTNIGFAEDQFFNPSNPYSASKAAAEMIVQSFQHSYGVKNTIVRANNIFGPRQFPEKLIPRTILRLKNGLPALLHGSGANKRCFLHVNDFCDAILLLFQQKKLGSFNIASADEYENREIVQMACDYLGLKFSDNVEMTIDRPHNDSRYLINCEKIKHAGWSQSSVFEQEIEGVFSWYLNKDYTEGQLGAL